MALSGDRIQTQDLWVTSEAWSAVFRAPVLEFVLLEALCCRAQTGSPSYSSESLLTRCCPNKRRVLFQPGVCSPFDVTDVEQWAKGLSIRCCLTLGFAFVATGKNWLLGPLCVQNWDLNPWSFFSFVILCYKFLLPIFGDCSPLG